jgi:hypothetical protein
MNGTGEEFGEEKLMEVLSSEPVTRPPAKLSNGLHHPGGAAGGLVQSDDITCAVLRRIF